MASQVEHPRLRVKQAHILAEDHFARSGGSDHHPNCSRFRRAAATSTSICSTAGLFTLSSHEFISTRGMDCDRMGDGGFTEEIIRAYLISRIVELLGDTRVGLLGAVLGSSLFYALNHEYQGLAGAIGAVVTCIGFGLLYLFSKRNLWSNVICHGLNDSVGFIAIYFGALS